MAKPANRKPEYNLGQLTALKWLAEGGGNQFMLTRSDDVRETEFVVLSAGNETGVRSAVLVPDVLGKGGLKIGLGLDGMYSAIQAGLATTLPVGGEARKRLAAALAHVSPLTGRDVVHVTDEGLAYWAGRGQADFAFLNGIKESHSAAVKRQVLIGQHLAFKSDIPADVQSKLPEWVQMPVQSMAYMTPMALATVVRETAARLYITDVVRVGRDTRGHGWRLPINEQDGYVERGYVMADDATPELAERLVEAVKDFEASRRRAAIRLVEQLRPLIEAVNSSDRQASAQMDEVVKDILAAHAAKAATVGGDEGQESLPKP